MYPHYLPPSSLLTVTTATCHIITRYHRQQHAAAIMAMSPPPQLLTSSTSTQPQPIISPTSTSSTHPQILQEGTTSSSQIQIPGGTTSPTKSSTEHLQIPVDTPSTPIQIPPEATSSYLPVVPGATSSGDASLQATKASSSLKAPVIPESSTADLVIRGATQSLVRSTAIAPVHPTSAQINSPSVSTSKVILQILPIVVVKRQSSNFYLTPNSPDSYATLPLPLRCLMVN